MHEDQRRILEDWPEAKFITAKQACVLGDHYHKIKTERFILLKGECIALIGMETFHMQVGRMYEVKPNTRHSFNISTGSVLLGVCSHPYDPNDDYK